MHVFRHIASTLRTARSARFLPRMLGGLVAFFASAVTATASVAPIEVIDSPNYWELTEQARQAVLAADKALEQSMLEAARQLALSPDPAPPAFPVAQIASNSRQAFFVSTDGSLWASEPESATPLFGESRISTRRPARRSLSHNKLAEGVGAVAVSPWSSVVLKTDGSAAFSPFADLFYFSRSYWELSSDPSVTVVETQVKAVASGDGHRLYLKSDGRVLAQGKNSQGQLGDGSTLAKATPVLVLEGVVAIAAKGDHSFFLKTDGSAWAAGDNSFGQLGDGSTSPRSAPVLVLGDVAAISTARTHTLFLKTDGTVWATGYTDPNLADSQAPTSRLVPVKIFTGAQAVSAGDSGGSPTTEPGFGLILKDDGSVWRFGRFALSGSAEPAQIHIGIAGIHAGEGSCHYIRPDGHVLVEGSDKSRSGLGRGVVFYREGNPAPVPAPIQITGHPRKFAVQVGPVVAASPHPYVTLTLPNDTDAINPPAPVLEVVDGPGFLAPITPFSGPRSRTLYLTAPGPVTVRSSCAGTFYYSAAPPQEQTIKTALLPQRITFSTPPSKRVTDLPFLVSATSTAGLPVAISVVEGPSAYNPETSLLTLTGLGTVRLRASSPGNETFAPAPDVDVSFEVSLTPQYLSFYAVPRTKTFGEPPFPLPITSTSPLPIHVTIVSGPAVLIEGGKLKLTGAGPVVISASQPGNTLYAPTEPGEHTIDVYSPPFIALSALRQTYTGLPLSVTAAVEVSHHPWPNTVHVTYTGPGYPASPQAPTAPGTYKVAVSFGPGGNTVTTGKLVIDKAALTVRVAPATRLVGQANPPFILTYEGFVGPDADNVAAAITALDKAPLASTKAKASSPAGIYDVTLSPGFDDAYRFVFPAPASKLTVEGFGGTYEALLVDADATPLGKLEVLVPANALTYTGVLHLASEPTAISLRGPLDAATGASATATWTRAADPASGISDLSLGFELVGDVLDGELSRDGEPALTIGSGSRLFVQPLEGKKHLPAPWTGAHTLVFCEPVALDEIDARPIPLGAGHASATIAATGTLTLRGKLADGTVLTTTAKADPAGRFRLFARPYGKRLDSFLSGGLPLEAHPNQARFQNRFHVGEDETRLVWAKTALPENTSPKNQDKSYRSGFSARVHAILDPWLAPSAKDTTVNGALIPAGTLAQRLDLADDAASSASVPVAFIVPESAVIGARATFLPSSLNLSAAGSFTVPTPLPVAPDNPAFTLKVTPATGAFSGSFVLRDQVSPPPAKPIDRKATFFGTLRQGPAGAADTLGHGHILFDPVPGDSDADSTEQISGELLFHAIP